MTPNRHERRKAASMKASTTLSKLHLLDVAVQIVAEADDLVTLFIESLRKFALTHPNVVYKKPVLLYCSVALSFGEEEDINKALADQGLVGMEYEAFDLAAHFGGKTVKEVVDLFFADEDAMHEALIQVVAGFIVQECGVSKHDLFEKYATATDTVFDLLGVPRQ